MPHNLSVTQPRGWRRFSGWTTFPTGLKVYGKAGPWVLYSYQALALLILASVPVLADEQLRNPFVHLPYLTGLVYLFCGLWVTALRRGEATSRAFGLFTTSVAIATAGWLDLAPTDYLAGLSASAANLAGGALINLGLLFPKEARLAVSYPIIRKLGYLPAAGLALFLLIARGHPAGAPFFPIAYEQIWAYNLGFFGLAGSFFLARTAVGRYVSPSPLAREQGRFVLWGTIISLAPLFLWYFSNLAGLPVAFTPYLLPPLVVFPLTLAYAILYYRSLHTGLLLSRGAMYALLSAMAVAGYSLTVSGLSLILGRKFPADHPYLIGLLVLVLALSIDPLRTRLQGALAHAFFRGEAARRARLQSFSQEATQVTDLPAAIRLLRKCVEQTLHPVQLHIFLLDPFTETYAAAHGENGRPTSDLRFNGSSGLAQTLARQRGALFLEPGSPLPTRLTIERSRLALLGGVLFIPLPGRQRMIGWLVLGPRRSGESYQREDLTFLERLGAQAAMAIERAQVIADLERRVREMNILARVAEGINVTLAFDDLLEMFYTQTNWLLPTRDFRITLEGGYGQGFYHAFYLEDDERLPARENRPLVEGQGLELEVVRTQKALVTEDYRRECRSRGFLPDVQGLYAWMSVPLNAGVKTIGAVSLGSRDPAVAYHEEHVSLLQAFADLAAGAIVKARLLEETEHRARQMAIINEVARSLSSTLELVPLLKGIMQRSVEILNCESGSLLLVDENTGESVFEVAVGPVGANLVGQRLPPGAGLVGKAVMTGEPIIQNEVQSSDQWFNTDQQTGYSTQDLLVVPMRIKERVIGVLEVLNKRDHSPFTIDDQELLTAFAGQAAVAIENARLYTLTDQALAARVEELSVMQRIDRELNTSLEVQRAMRITLEWSIRQSKASAGLVGIVTMEGVRIMASQGFAGEGNIAEGDYLEKELPALQAAMSSGQLQYLCIPDAQHAGATRDEAGMSGLLSDAQAQVIVPIRREPEVIGVILLESIEGSGFSEEIRAFLSRLSDHAAIAIANAQLYAAIQAANTTKSQFVSAAAHELKNPLTSIKGYSDLLLAGAVGQVSEDQANFLHTIRSNAERMSILVSDLQDISRIEAGQLRLKFSTVQLADVIEEVVRSLSRQVEEKSQTLEVETCPELPPVWADHDRLVQIFTNLISNAHKYSPIGGRVGVKIERDFPVAELPEMTRMVRVTVQDYGIGISPEDQKKIFQQFFRSDDPKVREVTGTGLGLTITKNLVEMQGGRIWFESAYQEGTTFHFTVPVAEM